MKKVRMSGAECIFVTRLSFKSRTIERKLESKAMYREASYYEF